MDSRMSMSSWVRSSSCAAISAEILPVAGAELVLARLPFTRDCDVRAGPMLVREVLDVLVAAEWALPPMSTEFLLPRVAEVL